MDLRDLGLKILHEIGRLRNCWSGHPIRTEIINLGRGNSVKKNALHFCDEYIAAIVDRFHEIIIIFDRESGQFKQRITNCPGVKEVVLITFKETFSKNSIFYCLTICIKPCHHGMVIPLWYTLESPKLENGGGSERSELTAFFQEFSPTFVFSGIFDGFVFFLEFSTALAFSGI